MRHPKWANKIKAPDKVLEFYKALQAVQSDNSLFKECHIFDGASIQHVPYINVQGQTIPLPEHIARFMGAAVSLKKKCPTHGCCNPYHFQIDYPTLKGLRSPPAIDLHQTLDPELDAYIEAIKYIVELHELPLIFEQIRPYIPTEDISDDNLKLALSTLS